MHSWHPRVKSLMSTLIFGIFRDFRDFLGFLGILGIFGIFRDFWDFRDFLGILGIFMEFLVEICESDFFGVITDASTKIRMCQPMRILSANKARMYGF